VDGVLEVQAAAMRQARETEKKLEDAERRFEAERQRAEELREELKRLRRENSDLRAEKAQAEKRASALEARAETTPVDTQRAEELERRLRKSEKENEHLRREIERSSRASAPDEASPPGEDASGAAAEPEEEPAPPGGQPISADANPHRRVLRQILKKLYKKGKIGASHTHTDNAYRGVPDHEKGIAKEAMDLLAREDFLRVKPTATDPHVSLNPDHTAEIRALIGGEISNPRLLRFVEQGE
jgi:predicted ribosome quality control (RQC) complex YloA/Tae2 family protein